jgi:endo-1,4-beta-xylanase
MVTLERLADLAVVLFVLIAACQRGRQPHAPPATAVPAASSGGESLIADAGIQAFELHGDQSKASISFVPVTGQPFDKALRGEVKGGSDNPWTVQAQTRTTAAVTEGDVVLATFYVRTTEAQTESAEGQTEFVFERAQEPWTKSVSYALRAGREWRKFEVPFRAIESYAPGEAQVIFRLGYEPEVIEIGGVSVINYRNSRQLADLPRTRLTYPGQEDDAAWRAEARERIEKHRKAELRVEVRDAIGNRLEGAAVSVQMKRQAFLLGTTVNAPYLVSTDQSADAKRYRQVIPEWFNAAVLENSLKWAPLAGDWGPDYTLEKAKQAVAWLREKGLLVRGHVLVWPSWRYSPKSLRPLESDPTGLREKVRSHVTELVTQMRGELAHWDVVNEPFDNHDLLDILGREEMAEWFRAARRADPNVRLYLNDYAILVGGGGDTAHRRHYEETVTWLLQEGTPLDGLGMQGHFGYSLTGPEEVVKLLDRYAKFKKPILITEYDIVIDDEELAARYTRDFLTAIYSHPSVEGFLVWGFWDHNHWKKNAPFFRKDWTQKPAAEAYRQLVTNDWTTSAQGETDAEGAFAVRAFLGSYEVTVQHEQQTRTVQVELGSDGQTARIRLK